MYPVHKEKYFVNKETFYNFTYDRHADIFKKEKNVNIIYGLGMFVAAVVTTIINFMSQSAKTDFV